MHGPKAFSVSPPKTGPSGQPMRADIEATDCRSWSLTEEKRILPRFVLQMPVTMIVPGLGLKMSGKTRDVSAGGIFFYIDTAITAQQEIELVLTLPQEIASGSVQVACRAKVLRVEQDRVSGKMGIAAAMQKFDFLTSQDTQVPGSDL